MQNAINDAQISTNDIDYISLHGTASKKNDASESIAIHQLFKNEVVCSSTKPLTGHTLGASSAIELGFCYLLLSAYNPQKILPAHCWDSQQDPELAKINLTSTQSTWTKGRFMCNALAFGGSNISLIIETE